LGDGDQQVSKLVAHGTPTATRGINQHSPLDRLTLAPQKKELNNNQGTEKDMQQKGQGALSALEKGKKQGAALHLNF
jgi:hypothetical protein